MLQRLNHRAGHYLVLLAAGAALFLVNLGGPTLWDRDEGRNATAAYEMLESGNWVVPTFNAQLRSHKPVLLYWLQAAAYALLGVNEFASRLPSALAALLTLLLTYELGRRIFDANTGVLAAVVLGSSALFCAAARFANPDALLNLFVVATVLCFWNGYARPAAVWFLLAGAGAGLAVLAKGPSGLVLPGVAVILFLAWERRLGVLLDWRLLLALGTCVLVALPWYVFVGVETRWQFLREFLLTHNVGRALSPMESHRGPFYYYPAVLIAGLAPWSVFLALGLWYGVLSALRRPWPALAGAWTRAADHGHEAGYRLLWCWVAAYLLAFSLAATKLPNYVLPAYAPLALVTARFLERWRKGSIDPPRWLICLSLACLALVGVGTALGLAAAGGAVSLPALRGRTFPGLAAWGLLGALPVLGAALAWWCWRGQRRTGLVLAVSVSAVLFIAPLAAWGAAALNAHKAPRPLIEQVGALRRDRDLRIGCLALEHLPSLNFYCQRTVAHLGSADEVAEFLRSPVEVYLFLPAAAWEGLAPRVVGPHRVAGRHADLYRGGEVVVVTNR